MTQGESVLDSEATKLARMAGVILVVRGTGVACAGLVACCDLWTTVDVALPWAAGILSLGVALALCGSAASATGGASRRAVRCATVLAVLWIAVALVPLLALLGKSLAVFDPFYLTRDPLWLCSLSALFMPDAFAIWVIHRRPVTRGLTEEDATRVAPGAMPSSGRTLVANGMCILATASSVAVAWLGPAVFLA